MRPTLAAVLACGALVASLTACGAESGTPTTSPTTDDHAPPTSATTAPTSTTGSADREIRYERGDLCELLTPEEAAEFGSQNPRPGNSITTGSEQCQWGGDMGITIDFMFDASGVRPTPGDTSDIEVAGTDAVLTETKEQNGLCLVRVTLNDDRSAMTFGASVLSSGRGKGYEPCDVAKQVAEIVIPKVKG